MTGEQKGGKDTMTTPVSNPEVMKLITTREGAANRKRLSEPMEDSVLADAEEEEMVQLWAGDRGNQGA
jgi:hypothetical protein